MKPAELFEIMATLKAAYPRQVISVDTVEAYGAHLVDLDTGAAKAAVERHIRLNQWFPSIAEIRRAALENAGTSSPLAGEAWAEAVDKARRYGYQNGVAPEFSHEAVTATVRAVGWKAICHTPDDEFGYLRKFFLDAYEDFRRREDAKTLLAPNVSPERRLEHHNVPALPEAAGDGEFLAATEAKAAIASILENMARRMRP